MCNECGDKYSNGTLGELLAPGAASVAREEAENDLEVKAEEIEAAAGSEKGPSAPVDSASISVRPSDEEDDVAKVALTLPEGRSEPEVSAGDQGGQSVQDAQTVQEVQGLHPAGTAAQKIEPGRA